MYYSDFENRRDIADFFLQFYTKNSAFVVGSDLHPYKSGATADMSVTNLIEDTTNITKCQRYHSQDCI